MTTLTTSSVQAHFNFVSLFAINRDGEQVSIEGDGQIFDHLVHVKWLSGPKEGESGWLLCSHSCKWPSELVEKADFLEGCNTPDNYREDSRLVLGFHPTTITQWDVKSQTIWTTPLEEGEVFSRTFQRGWEIDGVALEGPVPKEKRILALWRVFRKASPEGVTNTQVFDNIECRYLEGKIPLSVHIFSYVKYVIEKGGIQIFRESVGQTLPDLEGLAICEGNKIIVIHDDLYNGWAKAEPLFKIVKKPSRRERNAERVFETNFEVNDDDFEIYEEDD